MTIEVIKEALEKEGFNVSERDSFIKGVTNEIDLMIIKKNAKPIFKSYYDPQDVLAVFELKFRGTFGESDIKHIKEMFSHVRNVNPQIKCIYLTIYENQKYKNKATNENIIGEVFELFKPFHSINTAINKGVFYPSASGDWARLIRYLRSFSKRKDGSEE
jgi:hypothetical protein